MHAKLLKSFKRIFNNEKAIESYRDFYIALCDWVITNENLFINELNNHKRLRMLTQIDLDEYDLSKNDLEYLQNFKNRLIEGTYKTTDDLLETIENELWDLIAIEADIDCDCIDSDPRYIVDPDRDNEVLIECNYCRQLYDTHGVKQNRIIDYYKPANNKWLKGRVKSEI